MNPVRIDSKEKMYDLLDRGLLGNTVRYWNSRKEVELSGYRGEISLRSRQITNPVKKYHVPYADLDVVIAALPESQRSHPLIYCEAPPEHRKILQGELCYQTGLQGGTWYEPWLHFEYTLVPEPMRLAFEKERKVATGLLAKGLLERHVEPRDLDELLLLIELYPNHIIEFSAFDVPVGTIPGRKTVVWEVRYY